MKYNLATQKISRNPMEWSLHEIESWVEDCLYMAFPEETPEWVAVNGAACGETVGGRVPEGARLWRVSAAVSHGGSEGWIIDISLVVRGVHDREMTHVPLVRVKSFAGLVECGVQAAVLGYWLTDLLLHAEEPVVLACFRGLRERVGQRWELVGDQVVRTFPSGVSVSNTMREVSVNDEAAGETVWAHNGTTDWSGYGTAVAGEVEAMLQKLGGGRLLAGGARRCA